MKILAIADEESKYLWDFFEKSKLEGLILLFHAEIWTHDICHFLQPLLPRLSFMFMGIMTINMKGFRRTGVSALMIPFMCMRGSGSWGWAAPCGINPGFISLRKERCDEESLSCFQSFCGGEGLTFWLLMLRHIS